MLLYLTRGNQEPLIPIQYFNEPDIILGAYKQLDHMGTEPIRIAKVVCNVPNLYQYLSNINMSNGQTIQQLSVLEYFVDRMDENEAKVFAGALDSESINGLADIITVAKNLHLYELIPNVTNDTELGQYLAEHDLLNIAYPQETSQHWDLTAIGIAYYSDHVVLTRKMGMFCERVSWEHEKIRCFASNFKMRTSKQHSSIFPQITQSCKRSAASFA